MKKYLLGCLSVVFCLSIFLSGCGKNENSKKQTTAESAVDVLTSKEEIKTFVSSTVKKQTSEFPQLDYASDQRIMFHDNQGFFVFDLSKQKITQAVDLKKTGIFSQKSSGDGKIEVASDGSLVHFYQRNGKKTEKNYYFHIANKTITTKKAKMNKVYQGDFLKDDHKTSFFGVSFEKIKKTLEADGLNDSNVLVQNDHVLVYLGYPDNVYMKPGEEIKNLSFQLYDVKKNKTEEMPVWKGYVTLNTQTDAKKLNADDKNTWMKRAKDGTLYYDVDALKDTKAGSGTFGKLVIGNVFHSNTGKLVITIKNPKDFDRSLKPVLALNDINESGEAKVLSIDASKSTYTFTGLKKGMYYYIDYYPTKDPGNDQKMKKIDDHNAKLEVSISN